MNAFQRCSQLALFGVLAVVGGCGTGFGDNSEATINLLRQHFGADTALAGTGWKLRDISGAGDRFIVVLDFPPAGSGSRSAPVFTELVALCPVSSSDAYWKHRRAQPFSLFLSRSGKKGAEAIAFCTRSFDYDAYKRLTDPRSIAQEPLTKLPPAGSDTALLDKAVGEGSPSFEEAQRALAEDNTGRLQDILFSRQELVETFTGGGRTLLFDADSASEVKVLIAFGANPNVADSDGTPLLEWHAQLGDNRLAALRQLLEMGAAARHVRPDYAGSPEIALLLLDNGAEATGESLLEAIRAGMPGVPQVLYDDGARLDQASNQADVLHSLVRSSNLFTEAQLPERLNRLERFVALGGDINLPDGSGASVLSVATQMEPWHGKDALIERLVELGAEAPLER
ncbi:MAG: hypothetical protein AAGB27_06950 [Pseudomonadota bacterium]